MLAREEAAIRAGSGGAHHRAAADGVRLAELLRRQRAAGVDRTADPPRGARQHAPPAPSSRPGLPGRALARLAIDKPRRCLPSSGQRPLAWHDLSARRTGQEGVTRMRYRLAVGSLGLAMAAALDDAGARQDPGVLLGGQPGGLQPAALHCRHHLRRQRRAPSTTRWSSSSTARPNSGPASPRAGRSPTTGWNTPSICARGSSSRPPTASPRPAISTPMTWSTASSACGSRIIRTTASRAAPTSTSPALACRPC